VRSQPDGRRRRGRVVKAAVAACVGIAAAGALFASQASADSTSGQFVMFSNRSGFAPYVCVSAWDWGSYVAPHREVRPPRFVINYPESSPSFHECKRLGGGGKHVFWLPQSSNGFGPIRLMVSPTGTVWGKKYFDLAVNRSSCFRETSGGSVHEATDKPCTPN
jgi:hypothetical protein